MLTASCLDTRKEDTQCLYLHVLGVSVSRQTPQPKHVSTNRFPEDRHHQQPTTTTNNPRASIRVPNRQQIEPQISATQFPKTTGIATHPTHRYTYSQYTICPSWVQLRIANIHAARPGFSFGPTTLTVAYLPVVNYERQFTMYH